MRLQRKYGLGIAILLALANVADIAVPFVPAEWTPVVQGSSALLAAILVAVGYNSNPDGSNVRLPYTPKRGG